MNKKLIRVLIVEDSPVATIILKRILDAPPEIEVVGAAKSGIEGLEMIPRVQPDVICTDLHMPRMGGLEFTSEVMSRFPKPILVISSSVQPEDTHNVFKLLDAGAVDVFPKPRSGITGNNYEILKQELLAKIRVLAGVSVFTIRRKTKTFQPIPPVSGTADEVGGVGIRSLRSPAEDQRSASAEVSLGRSAGGGGSEMGSSLRRANVQPQLDGAKPGSMSLGRLSGARGAGATGLPQPHQELAKVKKTPLPSTPRLPTTNFKILTIGASTGGPQALQGILSQLPANFPVPTVCIQHISEGFLQGLVDWLNSECMVEVKIAPLGEKPQPGYVYFPPEGKHLEFDSGGRFVYSSAPPCAGHRPSVTVTFNAIAARYGAGAIAVLLTGMGRDGADGMLSISLAGGLTIAQNEASCVVFGMPKEAIALGAAKYVLPISDIPPLLLNKLFSKI
ncbi:MAG TPA: chemotaxis-specific protein-glutamate methyltransferase CheB [Oscillatoriaceae cyanobacterium M33_DOE_052]|uniref:Protein-glutamate methylesterase/protein-glutamine glutaminase n=1 Tax=Planktothricoides sp. SpSt-374 TaxID=2282167 RepID=A0A7C3VRU4_9CYAN|nr:chemotaxis-specific protein-glutamate methyltransferase CheB [Oscillatoriaceae cyanobacterium M33_DOE_052]